MDNNIILKGGFNTGKTRKLNETYLTLIQNKFNPLYFTNNPSLVLEKILPQIDSFEELWVNNFSSFAKKILRKYYSKNFKVISGFEQKLIFEKILPNLDIDPTFKKYKNYPNAALDYIDRMKLESQTDHQVKAYQKKLNKCKFLDYKDLITKATEILIEKPERIINFDYLIIDELEEITHLELKLLNALTNKHIYAAINENASIYGFRGADPERFANQFIINKKLKPLNMPSRSFSLTHLDSECVAKISITQNSDHLQSPEILARNIHQFSHEYEEVEWITRKIRELMLTGNYKFSDFVVLRRTLKESAKLYREIFQRLSLPLKIEGMGGVFDNPEVLEIVKEIKYNKNLAELKQPIITFLAPKITKNLKVNKFIEMVNEYAKIRETIDGAILTVNLFKTYLDEFWQAYTFETSLSDKNTNSVEVSTIQKFKGKHKKVVFLAGMDEGILPKEYATVKNRFFPDKKVDFNKFLQSERNIFNLAISRSKEEIFITSSGEAISHFLDTYYKSSTSDLITSSLDRSGSLFLQTKIDQELHDIFYKIKTFKFESSNKEKFYIEKLQKLLKNFYYSASSVKDYKHCNILFLLSRLTRISIQTERIALDFGNICHKILEKFHQKISDFTEVNAPISRTYLKELIDIMFEKNKEKFQGYAELRWYQERANKFLFDYLAELSEDADFKQILKLEKKFIRTINNINLVGRIDRIDAIFKNQIEIIDYKTGKHQMTGKDAIKQKIEDEKEFQMLFYYLLTQEVYQEKLAKLSYIWLEKETRGGKKASLANIDINFMKQAEINLIEFIKKIQIDDFKVKKQATKTACRNCRFNFICR
ncbi:MAG: UvrD-helicase domain-containing protein [Bacteroidetes bacterium]|nr:UvrD-helicase domain-containing protein [Bacteroidota bacterium]